jgi:hypothetical protein
MEAGFGISTRCGLRKGNAGAGTKRQWARSHVSTLLPFSGFLFRSPQRVEIPHPASGLRPLFPHARHHVRVNEQDVHEVKRFVATREHLVDHQLDGVERRAVQAGSRSLAQLRSQTPCLAVPVLHQLLGDPRYIRRRDREVRAIRPEAQRVESSICTARFAHADHAARSRRIQHPAALETAAPSYGSEIPLNIGHAKA